MKLNLDDNGYVVGWTLDESDKKLSSDEVHEKINALITEYKTKKIAEINESKERIIAEINSGKEKAISEMNAVKDRAKIEINSIKEKANIEINAVKDRASFEMNLIKEKYKLNNAKESHLNLNHSSYIFPSLPNTNN